MVRVESMKVPRAARPDADKVIAVPGASVTLDHVTRQFGELAAVNDICLDIKPGEFLTILGPSGSGKTTTLALISGLVSASRGRILLDAQDVTNTPPHKRNLGQVFQNYALFPHMTVAQNIMFPLKLRRMPQTKAKELVQAALSLVQLTGLDSRYSRQLSGGQQQRVALARALVYQPRVLLMDEPFGALDRKLRREMQLELRLLQHRVGVTIVFVTHDQEEALTLSDRIALMRQGQLVQVDSPRGIYDDPKDEFAADFVGDTNFFTGVLDAASGQTTVTTSQGTRLVVGATTLRSGASVKVGLRPERIRFIDRPDATELENVFPAHVEDTIFLGSSSNYVLRLPGGEILLARDPSVGKERRSGDMYVAWAATDAVVLSGSNGKEVS
jgi:spermidine/putrescine ABC transporter ATP-binding subunit